jgi:acetyl esterase/lipase
VSDVRLNTVVYGTGGGRELRMHLLLPEPRPDGLAPGLVWVHGGGWMNGSKDSGIPKLFPFARRGYVCATVEYRLTDEAQWPAQIEDVKCAVRYLRAHAAALRLDPDRIGAWGPSAGGHLVAMLGVAPNRPELEGSGGWADQSSRVQAVCDWFGPAELVSMVDQPSDIDRSGADYPEARLIGGRVQENPERARAASPTAPFYVTGREPPFLIVHGDADRIVPYQQSEQMWNGVGFGDTTFITIHGAGHGGPQFEHQAVLDQVWAFFDRTIGPAPLPDPVDLRPRVLPPAPPRMTTVAARSWDNPVVAPPLTTYRTFASAAAGGPVGYALYLPPGYDEDANRRYPMIYWLHGRGGDPRRGAMFVRLLDEAIGQGIAPPAIAVLPIGGPCGWYCDWADGSWPIETAIVKELIPHVDATYRTIGTREARVIEGQSMGGFGAAHLGFKYPELFGAVSLSAAALIDFGTTAPHGATMRAVWDADPARFQADDPMQLVRANVDRIRGQQAIRIFCGDRDNLLPRSQAMHALLDELGVRHEYEVVPGAVHSYDSKLERLGVQHFSWFDRALLVRS